MTNDVMISEKEYCSFCQQSFLCNEPLCKDCRAFILPSGALKSFVSCLFEYLWARNIVHDARSVSEHST